MAAASASSTRPAKRAGKENAPPTSGKARSIVPDEPAGDDSFGDMPAEDFRVKSKSASGVKAPSKVAKAKARSEEINDVEDDVVEKGADVRKKLATVTAERDRLRSQRDTYAKQFEELSRLRSTETEGLFNTFREKVEIQSKAQNEIISNLTALSEKMKSRITSLEKLLSAKQAEVSLPPAGGVFAASAPAPIPAASSSSSGSSKDAQELKALKEEMAKMRDAAKSKDEKITQLEKEYKAEVEHSRKLQAQSASSSRMGASQGSSALSTTAQEESEKDAMSLRFYEDLTELAIVNVRIKVGKAGKDATLNCLLTNKLAARTLHFKLRTYHEPTGNPSSPWSQKVHYQPEGLEHEKDRAFVDRLDHFKSEFTVEREQLPALWEALKAKMAEEEEDDE